MSYSLTLCESSGLYSTSGSKQPFISSSCNAHFPTHISSTRPLPSRTSSPSSPTADLAAHAARREALPCTLLGEAREEAAAGHQCFGGSMRTSGERYVVSWPQMLLTLTEQYFSLKSSISSFFMKLRTTPESRDGHVPVYKSAKVGEDERSGFALGKRGVYESRNHLLQFLGSAIPNYETAALASYSGPQKKIGSALEHSGE
ncbi:hypothetical protein EDB89DRAFT_2246153 [Lactarius sanguifluus]|nr:hypothetical protein EDB89DRAFT_2246153 [Lactarius sanguifluus]